MGVEAAVRCQSRPKRMVLEFTSGGCQGREAEQACDKWGGWDVAKVTTGCEYKEGP